MSMDVYYEEQKEDIPEIEVDIILVLSRYEGGNLSSPSARREIARELHRELLSKNYVKRQKRDSGA